MVVVDKLTKSAHFISIESTFKAIAIAQVFMKELFRLHGMPKQIIFDRDTKFTSNFWKSLMAGLETKLFFSTAYHPQNQRTDRKSEPNTRRHVKNACNASTQEVGRLPSTGGIRLQQRLPRILKDESV
jgi:murein L,D-transpeptidase YafK